MTINNWQLWLSLAVSALLLALLVFSIDARELVNVLREANYLYVIPAIGLYFVAVYFRAARWRYLLSPLGAIPVGRLYPVVIISYAANNLLPARLGELVRAYYLAQREPVSGSAALATIGVERIYDGLTLLAFGAVTAPLLLLLGEFDEAGSAYRTTALLISAAIGVVFLAALASVTLLATRPGLVRGIDRLLNLLPARVSPKLIELAHGFILGLSILNSPRQHAQLFLRSLPVWLIEGAVYLVLAYSFNLHQYLGALWILLPVALLVTATSNLATAIPVSIGGIGPFEVATQQTLIGTGVAAETATGYALALHLVALWLPVSLAGLALLWKENLSLGKLTTVPKPTAATSNSGQSEAENSEHIRLDRPKPKEDTP